MATAKIIEIIGEGKTIEAAINSAVKDATDTLEHVRQFDVKHIQAIVEKGKVVKFRVNGHLTFVVEK